MARGQSGRIVLEIDPAIKRAVHARLAGQGMTMKQWFLGQVEELLNPKQQLLPLAEGRYDTSEPSLLQVAEPRGAYVRRKA